MNLPNRFLHTRSARQTLETARRLALEAELIAAEEYTTRLVRARDKARRELAELETAHDEILRLMFGGTIRDERPDVADVVDEHWRRVNAELQAGWQS